MKILALSTKLNQISYTYSVDLQKARNAKTKLNLVQGPRFSFFYPPLHFGWLVFAFLAFWRPTDYVYKIWSSLVEGGLNFLPIFYLFIIMNINQLNLIIISFFSFTIQVWSSIVIVREKSIFLCFFFSKYLKNGWKCFDKKNWAKPWYFGLQKSSHKWTSKKLYFLR